LSQQSLGGEQYSKKIVDKIGAKELVFTMFDKMKN
jgi:hypothetical protein